MTILSRIKKYFTEPSAENYVKSLPTFGPFLISAACDDSNCMNCHQNKPGQMRIFGMRRIVLCRDCDHLYDPIKHGGA